MTPKLNSNFYLHYSNICLYQMYQICILYVQISHIPKKLNIEKDQINIMSILGHLPDF